MLHRLNQIRRDSRAPGKELASTAADPILLEASC